MDKISCEAFNVLPTVCFYKNFIGLLSLQKFSIYDKKKPEFY